MDDIYIDKLLSGDTNAYRYFLRTYKDMAFNIAVSIVKDDQYAEEVIQDAFIKAFNGLKSFNRTAKFKSWFYRIVVNESFQRLKKIKKRVPTLDTDEINNLPEEAMLNELGENEKLIKIRNAFTLLSPNECLALNLFYLEEYSLKDVSTITGWTIANTKIILHRARKNIRAILGISLISNN